MNNSSLKDCVDYLLINGSFYNSSLLDGKLGISIFFFLCSKHFTNQIYSNYAKELLDDVILNTTRDLSFSLHRGIFSLGWTINYLTHESFISPLTDDILEEIDNSILQFNPKYIEDLSVENGLCGIAFYVISRYVNPFTRIEIPNSYIEELHKSISIRVKGELLYVLNKALSKILRRSEIPSIHEYTLRHLVNNKLNSLRKESKHFKNVTYCLNLILNEVNKTKI